MTREEISKSLKPLEWLVWDEYVFRSANPVKGYEATVTVIHDGRMLVRIHKHGEAWSEVLTTVSTMHEAKTIVREWRIDQFCHHFKMND